MNAIKCRMIMWDTKELLVNGLKPVEELRTLVESYRRSFIANEKELTVIQKEVKQAEDLPNLMLENCHEMLKQQDFLLERVQIKHAVDSLRLKKGLKGKKIHQG